MIEGEYVFVVFVFYIGYLIFFFSFYCIQRENYIWVSRIGVKSIMEKSYVYEENELGY